MVVDVEIASRFLLLPEAHRRGPPAHLHRQPSSPMTIFYIHYVELLRGGRMTPRPMGYATLAVLQALVDGRQYGFDIVDHTGLATGTVYPALSSLEGRGLATADWEAEEVARADRRPPRKYYRVTPEGREALRAAMARMGALGLRASNAEPGPAR